MQYGENRQKMADNHRGAYPYRPLCLLFCHRVLLCLGKPGIHSDHYGDHRFLPRLLAVQDQYKQEINRTGQELNTLFFSRRYIAAWIKILNRIKIFFCDIPDITVIL